jgi:DDE_Tnp_1-associated
MLQQSKTIKEISFEESDLLKSIQQLPDPHTRLTQHSLIDIVTIAIMAVLSGADDWNAPQAYSSRSACSSSFWLELSWARIIDGLTIRKLGKVRSRTTVKK